MKSPEKIKKGLECCIADNCKGCPYYPLYEVFGCKLARAKDALAYIQKLEAQNAELLKQIEELKAGKARAESSCTQMAGTIRNLRKQLAPEPPKEE